MSLILTILITNLILLQLPPSLGADNDQFLNCSTSFQCANIQNLSYPFWGSNRPNYCGHPDYGLSCNDEAPQITILSTQYRVLEINQSTRTLNVSRSDYREDICPKYLVNSTLDSTTFSLTSDNQELSLFYDCPNLHFSIPNWFTFTGQFNCTINDTNYMDYFVTQGFLDSALVGQVRGLCRNSVVVWVNELVAQSLNSSANMESLMSAINGGFGLEWELSRLCDECERSDGQCGSDPNSGSFICHCKDGIGSNSSVCGSAGKKALEEPVIIGISVGGAAIIVILIGCWIFYVRRQKKMKLILQHKSKEFPPPPSNAIVTPSANLSQSVPSYPYSKLGVKKESNYFGAQVFSYVELEDATNNFNPSRELGDGGFGTVYYGKLRDGRVVAVKRLHENNFKRVQQFKNEVEILTRLKHQNLVKLYGCTSRRSRELLLVYEYIPNGTVADHLHGSRVNTGLLSWPIRLRIAIETADALAYLHQSEIIHRDVKTNNILLDSDFHVKVADFGLSRLFPNDVSHVSTAPQGTPGYVDPEYYQCYQLTHKSDVYSFGVVLIELISSLQAVDTSRHRNDINLANMGVSKIQNHAVGELVDPSLGFENDCTVRRMVTLVAELAFRCLQQARDMRPSMHEVLEVLRGLENENSGAWKAEEVDIGDNDVVLLKNMPSPPSPDSFVTDQWMKGLIRTM